MPSSLTVRNPYTGAEIAELDFFTDSEIQKTLDRSTAAFERWKKSTAFERSNLLLGVAAQLEAQRKEFVELIRDEAGKPIVFANAEVERCLGVLRWAAAETQRFAGDLLRLDAASGGRSGFGITTRFPRGVILGITPFNFPLNLVAHKVAPAVASGCSILIKPSPLAPLTAMRLAKLFEVCGAPEGLVQVAIADDAATEKLTHSAQIAMVSFTGSARVGKLVRAQAVDKPVTLELGGNAWTFVFSDIAEQYDEAIAKKIAQGAFGYAGQSCISVQNVAVERRIFDRFQDALAKATRNTAYGDPSDAQSVSGPVINESASKRIQAELTKARPTADFVVSENRKGAEKALLIPPTLVCATGDAADFVKSTLVQDEIFAPVMSLLPFDSADQAIAHANSGKYGLQAGVFTQNFALIDRLYKELEVGGVVVNDVPTTRYDHQPYGGVKDSGEGREGLRYAMEEMTEPKFLALSAQLPH